MMDEANGPDQELDDLYQEVLIEHARSKRWRAAPQGPCSCVEGFNPLCGDEVAFRVERDAAVIRSASFSGQGCAISQACASMAAQAIQGRSLEEARKELAGALAWVLAPVGVAPGMDDWAALGGVSKFPMRVKCATMPLRAALAAIDAPLGADMELRDEP